MEATSILLASSPIVSPPPSRKYYSIGHSVKQLHRRRATSAALAYKSIDLSSPRNQSRPFPLPRCSLSGAVSPDSQPFLLKPSKNLSFDWLKKRVSGLTPLDIVKVSGILSVSIAAVRWAVNLALNPFFWMYFSWSWLFWPWIVAVMVAVNGLYCLRKHLQEYNSSLYLAKYSEKIVVPTSVVQYGPYRWVRHPIYASTMLLFETYCTALRAPLSLLFVVGACVLYYEQKIRLEEALMIETFGEGYLEYARKVKHKLIPFVF
ncbi:hypothetical protein MLD38_017361 [Melastoma candidum]|uniref:Uncharacterized protein n=1 Tax=Melastoma candidum TaxID=119954 RepID=A0ACB9QUG1_9MYRT|nr:hypothetical protein MLD38_017361 [Melastoma candidum]